MIAVVGGTFLSPAILAIAIGVLTLVLFWKSNTHFVKLTNNLPGPRPVPIFGNALDLLVPAEKRLTVIKSWHEHFLNYPLMRLWLGNNAIILITRATAAETILKSSKHIDKAYEYSFLHPWLGTGLLTSTGSKWQSRRKLLTPAFHFKILDDFLQVFNEQSKVFIRKVGEESERLKQSFDIFPFITRCALDAICDAAMGRHVDAQENVESAYVKAVYEIGAIVQERQLQPWLQPDIIFNLLPAGFRHRRCLNILHGFTEKVIREKRDELMSKKGSLNGESKGKRLAFLDLLLEVSDDGRVLTDADIREEVDTFMFEGHDTTSAGIGWCLFLLGHHPEIQRRVQEELDSVFVDDPDRDFTMADLTELKYLECCIKEAQRLYPSVPIFSRSISEDVVLDGYVVPSGSSVSVIPYLLHRDTTYFPDPERFDPERFEPGNAEGRHPYAFVPFSAGPRNCIGQRFALMEEKVVIGSLLRKFSITSVEKREEVDVLVELITRPKNGVKVKLSPR